MPDGSRNEHGVSNIENLDPLAVFHIRYNNLDTSVQAYVNNIKQQIADLIRGSGFRDFKEFTDHIPNMDGEVSLEDAKRFELLMRRLTSAMAKNEIPKEDKEALEKHPAQHEQIAVEILGRENVFGQQAIENTFGTKLETKDIPSIPFTKAELERAKELNQFLILRIDKASDGQPLTMQKMIETTASTSKKAKDFFDTIWYLDEPFFTQETPTFRWSLVSKEVLPDSTLKNYVDQTQMIVDYLTNEVFKGQTVPEPYSTAIQEFLSKKVDFINRISTNWQQVAKELEELQLTILTRQTPAEVFYDTIIRFNVTNITYHSEQRVWTRRCYSDKLKARVSGKDAMFMFMPWCSTKVVESGVGVVFAR